MTKVRYVPGLSAAAKKLLQNIEHTTRKIPGTQEVRRVMRFDIHAYRVRYGVPIFVTFSPDEANNMVMLRLARSRTSDPCHCADAKNQPFGSRHVPDLEKDHVDLAVPLTTLLAEVPAYDERRAILARDGLASVDGFRAICLLVATHLWGVRVCGHCPDCNNWRMARRVRISSEATLLPKVESWHASMASTCQSTRRSPVAAYMGMRKYIRSACINIRS